MIGQHANHPHADAFPLMIIADDQRELRVGWLAQRVLREANDTRFAAIESFGYEGELARVCRPGDAIELIRSQLTQRCEEAVAARHLRKVAYELLHSRCIVRPSSAQPDFAAVLQSQITSATSGAGEELLITV